MLLIDVTNLLHASHVLPPDLAGLELDGLLTLLGRSRVAQRALVLVCDGTAGSWTGGRDPLEGCEASGLRRERVRVVFAGETIEADDVIEEHLQASNHPREVLVVSSDRRLKRAASHHGAKWISSPEFLRQLARDAKHAGKAAPALRPRFATDLPLSPADAAVWAHALGLTEEDPVWEMPGADGQSGAGGGAGVGNRPRRAIDVRSLLADVRRSDPAPSLKPAVSRQPTRRDQGGHAGSGPEAGLVSIPLEELDMESILRAGPPPPTRDTPTEQDRQAPQKMRKRDEKPRRGRLR